MHVYYMNAIQDFQEKNLRSGQRIALAMMNCFSQAVTSQIGLSQMLMSRGSVHFDTDHPDLNVLWATLFSDSALRESMVAWIQARVSDGDAIGQLIREGFEQQIQDVRVITEEVLDSAKLKDAGPGAA